MDFLTQQMAQFNVNVCVCVCLFQVLLVHQGICLQRSWGKIHIASLWICGPVVRFSAHFTTVFRKTHPHMHTPTYIQLYSEIVCNRIISLLKKSNNKKINSTWLPSGPWSPKLLLSLLMLWTGPASVCLLCLFFWPCESLWGRKLFSQKFNCSPIIQV